MVQLYNNIISIKKDKRYPVRYIVAKVKTAAARMTVQFSACLNVTYVDITTFVFWY